jgi:hypothetical protein
MFQFLGRIASVDIPDPVPGVEPQPEGATVTVSMEYPNTGTITAKLYPAAANQFRVGYCRVQIDAG